MCSFLSVFIRVYLWLLIYLGFVTSHLCVR